MSSRSRVAVLPVRGARLPAGAVDAVRAAGGRVVLVGQGAADAAASLAGVASEATVHEAVGFAPAAWSAALAPLLRDVDVVVLPSSPDGRDLAPRIAALLGRPLLSGAVSIGGDVVSTACLGGAILAEHPLTGPIVVTVQPGPGHEPTHGAASPVEVLDRPVAVRGGLRDATVVEVLEPDVATMDLAEAERILGGGAGLDSAERFEDMATLAAVLGASMGATRVVTDRGWVPHSRQIGTTGVVVDPELYVAFGISGAVQHTAGLGDPDHIISVNTDPFCPMMAMADLAVVADANATIDELLALVGAHASVDDPDGTSADASADGGSPDG